MSVAAGDARTSIDECEDETDVLQNDVRAKCGWKSKLAGALVTKRSGSATASD